MWQINILPDAKATKLLNNTGIDEDFLKAMSMTNG